jgi:LCP family protein required for cell wall assembly
MFRRDRPRGHAAPAARARGIQAAVDRDEQVRAGGSDPTTYEQVAASGWGPPQGSKTGTQPIATARRPRRRMSPKRIALIGIGLVLVILVLGSVLLYQRVDAFNRSVSSAGTLSTALFGPFGGSDRVNVLLIGYAGDPKHGGTYLADSMNVISVDPTTKATTLIPIPRDLWIQGLPELPQGGKANEVFAVGWSAGGWREAGRAQAAVISRITGLRITHWIALDFAGFSRAVDAVGGVSIYNPRAFKYTWSEANFANHHWSGGSFVKGTLTLNGKRALDYARTRYTSVTVESSDFARSVRQQRVLAALRDKIGGGGFGSLGPGLALMDAFNGHMRTDLSAFDLFLLSDHLHPDRRLELKEGVVLQAGRNNAGQYVLFPVGARTLGDYAPLRKYIATELAKPIPSPKPSASASPTPG